MKIDQRVDIAIGAAVAAGKKILEIYQTSDFDVTFKSDSSPLTIADTQSNAIIQKILQPVAIPVLSEESSQAAYQVRKDWKEYWLVDPLDGTKEFIKRNDEFTVNIALMQNNEPVAGVIYVPVADELFVGTAREGAFKLKSPRVNCTFADVRDSGEKLPITGTKSTYTVALSRSHRSPGIKGFLDELRRQHSEIELISKGSALKICMVAEGIADVFPRFGPTMEWDTAAGHAIVKAVGKNIWQTDMRSELRYNKQNLTNPDFIVI
jgi:3'(2'), 5'-bisphosphate nucleotidase